MSVRALKAAGTAAGILGLVAMIGLGVVVSQIGSLTGLQPSTDAKQVSIELADLNQDGKTDILCTNGDAFDNDYVSPWHGVQWLENRGDGFFRAHRIGDLAGAWNEIPEASWGVIEPGANSLHPFRPRSDTLAGRSLAETVASHYRRRPSAAEVSFRAVALSEPTARALGLAAEELADEALIGGAGGGLGGGGVAEV